MSENPFRLIDELGRGFAFGGNFKDYIKSVDDIIKTISYEQVVDEFNLIIKDEYHLIKPFVQWMGQHHDLTTIINGSDLDEPTKRTLIQKKEVAMPTEEELEKQNYYDKDIITRRMAKYIEDAPLKRGACSKMAGVKELLEFGHTSAAVSLLNAHQDILICKNGIYAFHGIHKCFEEVKSKLKTQRIINVCLIIAVIGLGVYV